MSEDSIPAASGSAENEAPAPAKATRRVSTPRPKKTAKKAASESAPEEKISEPAQPSGEAAPVVSAAEPAPVRESTPAPRETPARDESAARPSWPEPETIQGEAGTSGGKRKRRRKKKGGNAAPNQGDIQSPRPQVVAAEATAALQQARPQQTQPQPPQAPRVQLELEEVSKKAWKIYLSEVSEEGLALIGDNDARDLSRRSFRLAEIFLEEKARRSR